MDFDPVCSDERVFINFLHANISQNNRIINVLSYPPPYDLQKDEFPYSQKYPMALLDSWDSLKVLYSAQILCVKR